MISATHFHAMVIHFPIALIITAFISELLAYYTRRPLFGHITIFLLAIGTIGTMIAYASGNFAGDGIERGILQIPVEVHEESALVTMWLAIIASLLKSAQIIFRLRQNWLQLIVLMLFLLLSGSVVRTGYLGGKLVFTHGAGVENKLPDMSETSEENF